MSRIVHSYIENYLREISPPGDEDLQELRAFGEGEDFPILKPETESFFRFLLPSIRPKRILELGTAMGYSALVFHRAAPESQIDTVEIQPEMAIFARTNIQNHHLEDKIHLHIGDAAQYLKEAEGPYDLIFVDAAKAQIPNYVAAALPLLSEEGWMVVDNVLYHGMIASKRFFEHRKITIVKRLRKFLPQILAREDVHATVLPIGDGLLLIRKNTLERGSSHEEG
ncbi:MAG: O-methyltransferase [Tissierellia bacterium]|nr:O-methyltransferase [Tissierellia bacterium]